MALRSKIFSLVPGSTLYRNYHDYKYRANYYESKYLKANHLYNHFKTQFGPGHFYSPYVDLKDIEQRRDKIFDRTKQSIEGIDIQEDAQLELLSELAKHYKDLPYKEKRDKQLRYFFGTHAYSYTDAVILFCMLRQLKPKRVVEIGSGYSSALMLDVKQHFDKDLDLTFIEPYPKLLKSLAKPRDKYTLINRRLHETDPTLFKQLRAGDVLFIDSTHVAKPGSDVNQIYFKILPALNKGVIVHIHDIFYPFEYPIDWVKETRAWNEDYIVRAFLYNNSDYKINLFNHFINLHRPNELNELMPITSRNTGGSLWLEKLV